MKAFLIAFLLIFPEFSIAADIQFFGDLLLSRGVEELIKKEGGAALLKGVEPLFEEDIINIANLEGAMGNKSSCAHRHNPCFSINPSFIDILTKFDFVGLANNHSLDLGLKGFEDTVAALKSHNITPLGGMANSAVIETDAGNIGIIAVTDVLNSQDDRQFMPMADSPQVIDTIRSLKSRTSFVAAYIHWGKELDNLPTKRMKKLTLDFIKAGVDLIVGHHPHVVGNVECIEGRPIVYSLGNFVFDQKYGDTKNGAVLRCGIDNHSALSCKLVGVKTPMNTFTPFIVTRNAYSAENRTLVSCKPTLLPVWSGIFSKDEKEKRLVLMKKQSAPLSHIELQDITTDRLLWKGPDMPIEKLQPIDINNDGILEVMLIQNIFSSLDNEVGKRIYVYSIGQGLKAMWRGSAMSRPLLDAILVKSPGESKPILIALHTPDSFLVRNPKKQGSIVMSYEWNGFGFTGLVEKRLQVSATRLLTTNRGVKLLEEKGRMVFEFTDIKEFLR